jgi:putative membrane protein
MHHSPKLPAESSRRKSNDGSPDSQAFLGGWLLRGVLGGMLMGLANLVPGISGGTMLLVSGVYEHFITGLSEISRLQFRSRSLMLLGIIVGTAALSVLVFAGLLKEAILDHRWIMYSLFIGLTLGGLPLLYRMASPLNFRVLGFALFSFLVLLGLLVLKVMGYAGTPTTSTIWSLLAGLAGASAMILPGISGAYLLILMGQYETLLQAIEQFKDGLKGADRGLLLESFQTLIPVGIGVALGVLLISNLLKWLLNRYQQQTLGLLIGLLLGSVCGLYPFQDPVKPEYGTIIKQKMVTAETIEQFAKKDWPVESRWPTGREALISLLLVGIGCGLTIGISRIGSRLETSERE